MSSPHLNWLKKVNDFLEQLPDGILTYFDAIVDLGEDVAQSLVDSICEYAAWVVNINVERVRQKVLKALYNQNAICKKIIDLIGLGKKFMQDPLGAVLSFFDPIVQPYKDAIEFTIELIQEISRLAENLAKIAEVLPPAPPNPRINYDAFSEHLQLGVISMGALSSADSLPDPEILFPKPEFPFSRANFAKSFEEGKSAFKENVAETNKNIKGVFKKEEQTS